MPAPNTITPDKLARLIGTPSAPAMIDVRHMATSQRIPGSLIRQKTTVAEWSTGLRNRAGIVIDGDGTEAHGVAAWLRAERIDAEALEGGVAGWTAAGLPVIDTTHLPPYGADGRTTWVTRARPKVDRIACPWLIRRFVDPQARFLFLPPGEVLTVATQMGAEPFDIDAPSVF